MRADAGLAHLPSTSAERRRVLGLIALSIVAAGAALPWAGHRLMALPQWVGLYATTVALIDTMTFLMLLPSARSSRSVAWIACSALYGALMATFNLLLFPGAVLPDRPVLVGDDSAVGWVYLSWRLGLPLMLLVGVLTSRDDNGRPPALRRLVVGTVAAAVLLFALAEGLLPPYYVRTGVFPPVAQLVNVLTIALGAAAALLIWKRGLLARSLYLSLCLVLVLNMLGMTLTVVGGSRFTLGWYLARVEHVATALVLLSLLLRHVASLWGEQRFRTLADHAPVLMWQTDRTGIVFVNQAYADFVGRPWQQLTGRASAEFLHPDDAADLAARYDHALGRRERFEAQFRFRRHDGEYRWVQTVGSPHVDPDGRFVGYIGSSYDITEHKLNEQRLTASEAWFRETADAAPTIMWVTDEHGHCNFLSRGWYALTGQTLQEGLGLGWTHAVHPDDQPLAREAFLDAWRRQGHFRLDYRLRTADGQWRWFIDLGAPRFDRHGRFLGHVGSVVDITDRKLAELENARLTKALQQADRRKDDFLATLAHELRNPLAPLRSGLAVIRRAPNAPGATKTAAMMERQIGHIVRLVDDLMDVARITQGRISLVMAPLRLQPLLQHVAELQRPQIEGGGQRLTLDLQAPQAVVRGDEARLQQVVGNLLSNASKYSPAGATVTLALRCSEGVARLEVRDEGEGLPPEQLEAAFERFSGLNQALGRQQPGLGLGLSVVRGLVERHGGRVQAHSEGLGRGATFVVELPLLDAVASLHAHSGSHDNRGLSVDGIDGETESDVVEAGRNEGDHAATLRVLVVDDNQDAAESLAAVLALEGHFAESVHRAQDAVSAALRLRPDAVFVDLAMPGMDGCEVARHLRAEPSLEGALLVALTGFGASGDRDRTRSAGFDAHLVKPADPNEIERLLREHLSTRQPAGAAQAGCDFST